MIFTAWTNGTKGFGLKISEKDRNIYFSRDVTSIKIQLPNNNSITTVTCNTNKKSFWNSTCRELINSEIEKWLKENNFFPWEKGNPPKFEVKQISLDTYKILKKVE